LVFFVWGGGGGGGGGFDLANLFATQLFQPCYGPDIDSQ